MSQHTTSLDAAAQTLVWVKGSLLHIISQQVNITQTSRKRTTDYSQSLIIYYPQSQLTATQSLIIVTDYLQLLTIYNYLLLVIISYLKPLNTYQNIGLKTKINYLV